MALPALPLIIIISSAIAGTTGIGVGAHGAVQVKNASDLMEDANDLHEKNLDLFRKQNVETCRVMDKIGMLELSILKSFGEFSKLFEKLRDKPEFNYIYNSDISLPKFSPEEIKEVSVGAVVVLNMLTGSAAGAAGGFAAVGATTAAVSSLGTTAGGTLISTLSGAAATNATLAALGGGAVAAGGGGIALGSFVLNLATAGVALLIGGIIFSAAGSSLSDKADEAWGQVQIEKESVNKICDYLKNLSNAAEKYSNALVKIRDIYIKQLSKLRYTVNVLMKTDYHNFSEEERINLQNAILLVGLLHEMCKVKLVIQNENEDDINSVNEADIDKSISNSENILVHLTSVKNAYRDEYDNHIDRMIAEQDATLNVILGGKL